jgi:hypothetical protein
VVNSEKLLLSHHVLASRDQVSDEGVYLVNIFVLFYPKIGTITRALLYESMG